MSSLTLNTNGDRRSLSHIGLIATVLILTTAMLLVYFLQIAETNAYMGYEFFPLNLEYWISLTVSLSIIFLTFPLAIKKPSDFLFVSYSVFVLWPYAVFHRISSDIEVYQYALRFAVLYFPLLIIWASTRKIYYFPVPVPLLPLRQSIAILTAVSAFVAVYALLYAPASASLDLETVYERRIEGRDIFIAGSIMAYLLAMTANGFLPFIAFYASLHNRPILLLIVGTMGLAFYYVIGVKAPFFYIGAAYVLGWLQRRGRIDVIIKAIIYPALFAFILVTLEWGIYDASEVAEIYFRRVFMVPAHVISSYFDFFGSSESWMLYSGVATDLGVSYVIGVNYFHGWESNVNTGAFLVSLGSGGLGGYLGSIIIVLAISIINDRFYDDGRRPSFMLVGIILSLLLIEQAVTTALLSSGIAFVILFNVFALDEKGQLHVIGSKGG